MSDTNTFQLSGLHCESCTKITQKRVEKIQGVEHASADLDTGMLTVHSDRKIDKSEIEKVLQDTEYSVI